MTASEKNQPTENSQREDKKPMMPAYGNRTQPAEGIAVVGEALRRAAPESAEFLIEITAGGATGSQATQNHQTKTTQIAQAVAQFGVQQTDLQVVSLNVVNSYAPWIPAMSGLPGMPQMPALPQYGGPQAGHAGMNPYAPPTALQPEMQFGATHHARSVLRVKVRDAARAGEVVDALAASGATLLGGLCFHPADETGARKSALEAAVKDARAKAETVATAAGRKLGDPVAITEDMVASNGVYSTLRTQAPWAFGPDTPTAAGELEYYARVTASFRFQ